VRYGFLTGLFSRGGFEVSSEPVDMEAELDRYGPPSWLVDAEDDLTREGFRLDHAREEHHEAFLAFMRETFPGPWCERAEEHVRSGEDLERAVLALDRDGRAVGFVRFGANGEHGYVDSIGVGPEMRGRKVGSVLLARALRGMVERGARLAHFGYTNAVRFYEGFGAKVVRRYRQFKKEL
jgi:ribosomal protein S18 acetylase RimI-like enzyme